MPTNPQQLHSTLAEIKTLVSTGQTDEAIKRLAILCLQVSPGDEHSKTIGDLYSLLGYHAMAGRYWYLLNDKTDQMLLACEEFERSLGNNPHLISEAVGGFHSANPKQKEIFDTGMRFYRDNTPREDAPRTCGRTIGLFGCSLVIVILLVIFKSGIDALMIQFR